MSDEQKRIDCKEDIAYMQNYAAFGPINAYASKLPMNAMVFTVVLLLAVVALDVKHIIVSAVLVLVGLANLVLIPYLFRVRFILGQMIMAINEYDERFSINRTCGKWWDDPEILMKAFGPLLFLTGLLCFGAAVIYFGNI